MDRSSRDISQSPRRQGREAPRRPQAPPGMVPPTPARETPSNPRPNDYDDRGRRKRDDYDDDRGARGRDDYDDDRGRRGRDNYDDDRSARGRDDFDRGRDDFDRGRDDFDRGRDRHDAKDDRDRRDRDRYGDMSRPAYSPERRRTVPYTAPLARQGDPAAAFRITSSASDPTHTAKPKPSATGSAKGKHAGGSGSANVASRTQKLPIGTTIKFKLMLDHKGFDRKDQKNRCIAVCGPLWDSPENLKRVALGHFDTSAQRQHDWSEYAFAKGGPSKSANASPAQGWNLLSWVDRTDSWTIASLQEATQGDKNVYIIRWLWHDERPLSFIPWNHTESTIPSHSPSSSLADRFKVTRRPDPPSTSSADPAQRQLHSSPRSPGSYSNSHSPSPRHQPMPPMADAPRTPLRSATHSHMTRSSSNTFATRLSDAELLPVGDAATHGLGVSFNNAADSHFYVGHDPIQQLAIRVDFKEHEIVRDYVCAGRDEVTQLLVEYASVETSSKAFPFTMPKSSGAQEDSDRSGSGVDSDADAHDDHGTPIAKHDAAIWAAVRKVLLAAISKGTDARQLVPRIVGGKFRGLQVRTKLKTPLLDISRHIFDHFSRTTYLSGLPTTDTISRVYNQSATSPDGEPAPCVDFFLFGWFMAICAMSECPLPRYHPTLAQFVAGQYGVAQVAHDMGIIVTDMLPPELDAALKRLSSIPRSRVPSLVQWKGAIIQEDFSVFGAKSVEFKDEFVASLDSLLEIPNYAVGLSRKVIDRFATFILHKYLTPLDALRRGFRSGLGGFAHLFDPRQVSVLFHGIKVAVPAMDLIRQVQAGTEEPEGEYPPFATTILASFVTRWVIEHERVDYRLPAFAFALYGSTHVPSAVTPASNIAVNAVWVSEGLMGNDGIGVRRSLQGRGIDFVFQDVQFNTVDYKQVSQSLNSLAKGVWASAGGARAEWRAILRYERMPLLRLAGDRVFEESESEEDGACEEGEEGEE